MRRGVVAIAVSALALSSAAPAVARASGSRLLMTAEAEKRADDIRAAMDSRRLAGLLAVAGVNGSGPTAPDNARSTHIVIEQLFRTVSLSQSRIRDALEAGGTDARTRSEFLGALQGINEPSDPLNPDVQRTIEAESSVVAVAIDRALTSLPSGSATTTGVAVDGCDVLDDAPNLCIAGTGANTISEDYALVVDLGGNDVHANSAGGADPTGNGLAVSVTIDLGGNDSYDVPLPTPSGSAVAQGAGLFGAGFLVDVAGNDRYGIAAEGSFALALGQGQSLDGVGMLADMGGDDSYALTASGAGVTIAGGQGGARVGVGILSDASGNDQYLVRATATAYHRYDENHVAPPMAHATGLGTGGWTGPLSPPDGYIAGPSFALLADAGGSDTLDIEAVVPVPPEETFWGPQLLALPEATALGLGVSYQLGTGTGVAVFGMGHTDASISAVTRAQLATAATQGMGYGIGTTSLGMLSDAGGDDVRRLVTDVRAERDVVIPAACTDCDDVDTWSRTGRAVTYGMGYGEFLGLGLLDDGGGADRYIASASSVAESTLDDRRDQNTRSTSISGAAQVWAQGSAFDGAVGELTDAFGNDVYQATAESVARASHEGLGEEREAVAMTAATSVIAQGSARSASVARLTDLGGQDTYSGLSTATAEATPPTMVRPGTPTAGVLASVGADAEAVFIDADGGAQDVFTATPSSPACVGTRGQSHWIDCGGNGAGLMV